MESRTPCPSYATAGPQTPAQAATDAGNRQPACGSELREGVPDRARIRRLLVRRLVFARDDGIALAAALVAHAGAGQICRAEPIAPGRTHRLGRRGAPISRGVGADGLPVTGEQAVVRADEGHHSNLARAGCAAAAGRRVAGHLSQLEKRSAHAQTGMEAPLPTGHLHHYRREPSMPRQARRLLVRNAVDTARRDEGDD